MKALLFALLAGAAAPALAQHPGGTGHSPPEASAVPACTPEHAAMGHCTLPAAPAPAPAPPLPPSGCTPDHAAMGHCRMPAEPAPAPTPPPASCTPNHAAMGHCKLEEEAGADPHAGHGAANSPPVAPPPVEALSGPPHAADLVFGEAAMRKARRDLVNEHGNMRFSKVLIDQLEARAGKGPDGYVLDAEAWHGGDINKLWLKTEIEGELGRTPEQAEVQALWSRAIDPWFDLQAGARLDAAKGPKRTHLVLGVQGLAPYWWEVEGAVFLSNKGEVSARAEAEYDLRITQQLILQPRVELDLSLQDVEELGLGSGLTTADLGLRLRYQLSPLFSPYVGLSFERSFGDTRRFRREKGEHAGRLSFVTGIRWWF